MRRVAACYFPSRGVQFLVSPWSFRVFAVNLGFICAGGHSSMPELSSNPECRSNCSFFSVVYRIDAGQGIICRLLEGSAKVRYLMLRKWRR